MSKALFVNRRSLVLFVLLAAVLLTAGAASASQTYRFANGISFSYPSGYQPTEVLQGVNATVVLMNMSDPVTNFVLALTNTEQSADYADWSEQDVKAVLPQGVTLLAHRKMTVAGKDAILTEFSTTDGASETFTRTVIVPLGPNTLTIVGQTMGSNKINEARRIAEGIEGSLRF